jgi:hypothetical protein
VYNRDTKEDGAVSRVYETNDSSMYEVAVPKHSDSWVVGFYLSVWAEDVLELSNNIDLKSSAFALPASDLSRALEVRN